MRIIIIIIIKIQSRDTKSSNIFEETSQLNFTKQKHNFLCICPRAQWLGEGVSSLVYCREGCNEKQVTMNMMDPRRISECFTSQQDTKQFRHFFLKILQKQLPTSSYFGHFRHVWSLPSKTITCGNLNIFQHAKNELHP